MANQAIVCGPVANIPGATPDSCSECGAPVMVAPSSREIQATSPNDTVIICITCAFAAAKAQGAVKINPLTESQKQEIKEAINRGKS